MADSLLINSAIPALPRVAVLSDQKLTYLDLESQQPNRSKGNIYKAKISSLAQGIESVFVDYGEKKDGFLPLKEIASSYFSLDKNNPDAKPSLDRLRIGQDILIQIDKEKRGEKGAAITTFISLAGAYLVLMPYNPSSGGVSKKADSHDRDLVRDKIASLKIPEGFGIIVRTAGVNRSIEDLQWDLDNLLNHWQHIQDAFNQNVEPCLLHKESNAVLKAARDLLHPNIEKIVVDDQDVYQMMMEHLNNVRPEFVSKLFFHQSKVPLFTHYQVEEQIEKLFFRKIDLPSGGSIVIDYCEALTAIDVNSAKSTKGHDIEETALKTNLEAAEEISRQVRLRDISGIIVIDFIDMADKNNRYMVENAVSEYVQMDRAKIRLEPISQLTGCMIVSRQRVNTPIYETNQEPCSCCNGLGLVRTIHSNAHMMLRKIEEYAATEHTDILTVQLPVQLSTYLLNECRDILERIYKDYQTFVMIIPREQLSYPKYLIKRHKIGKGPLPESIKQIDDIPINEQLPVWSSHHQHEEPKVTQHLIKHPEKRKKTIFGQLVNFIKKLFGFKVNSNKNYHSSKKQYHNSNNRNYRRSPIHRRRNTNNTNNPQ